MKTVITLLALTGLATAAASAQEKAPAKTAAGDKSLQLAPAPVPSGADLLIPDTLPQNPPPRRSGSPQPSAMPPAPASSARGTAPKPPKVNKTQVAEDEVKQRLEYRLAKNKAVRDPAVVAAWAEAERARTDFDRREWLKRYYSLLNTRIRKIDGSLSKVAVERETDAARRLQQTRIDPTEPLDPTERTLRDRRE